MCAAARAPDNPLHSQLKVSRFSLGSSYIYILAVIAILAFTALVELRMGRPPFCKCGIIRPWSGEIWSNQNSQQFADPYTFTHILHGVLIYALVWLVGRKRLPAGARFVAAVVLECGWELFENTDFIIRRYRDLTISLDYFGDSVFNSIGDICAMMTGYFVASNVPVRITIAGGLLLDLFLLFWFRDSLAINILMLIYPMEGIKNWQMFR